MVGNRRSVATIDKPEFLKITSISPLISKCEIKVLYVGENRNRSFITKEVASEMAQSLPGTPIVGRYLENKEDFGDHGDQMIIDGDGIHFKSLTKPYGFVAPDAKIWFQKFQDIDEFGNEEIREYLMTEGYLWTSQYEECKRVIEQGNGQSMELDKDSLKGYWSENQKTGVEFFIINDAIFSKLCILGDDVEACFEGASITAPQVSRSYAFTQSLYSMMEELKFTLSNKGGLSMNEQETNVVEEVVETPVVEENAVAAEFTNKEATVVENEVVENFSENEDKNVESVATENENTVEDFVKQDDEEDSKEECEDKEEKKEEKPASKHSLSDDEVIELQKNYEELQLQFSALNEEVAQLRKFKKDEEDKQKDELIKSFYMLSDEDKKEIIDNKSNYSLDDIEAKLSVICVRKKVNFAAEEQTSVPTTYNLDSVEESCDVPAWLQAVENLKNSHKN